MCGVYYIDQIDPRSTRACTYTYVQEAGLAHVSVRADGNTLGDSAAARVAGPSGEGGEGGVAMGDYEAEALGVVKEIVGAQQRVCVYANGVPCLT